jgi:hypothetical protein
VLVTGHGLDLADADVRLLAARSSDPLFASRSVPRRRRSPRVRIYKTAAEIGELGDNTRIRAQIRDDDLLQLALDPVGPARCSRRAGRRRDHLEPRTPLNHEELARPG